MTRCKKPHPKFKNEECHQLLYEMKGSELHIYCDRCGQWTVVDTREGYTASEVDSVEVAV